MRRGIVGQRVAIRSLPNSSVRHSSTRRHATSFIGRAKHAYEQDSGLQSYDAKTYQRISVGLGFKAIGRNRLLFRTEVASRVRWSRTGGAVVDITGERAVAPALAGADDEVDAEMQWMSPVPYYPGREALWIGGEGRVRAEVDDRELVHPLAIGSEAYYQYSTGDSLILTLSDGAKITLRELRIEPRRPEWRLSVGSFWFDVSSGQLVRAVYRFSAPMDIWAVAKEESKRHKEDPSREGGMTDLREIEGRGRRPRLGEGDDVAAQGEPRGRHDRIRAVRRALLVASHAVRHGERAGGIHAHSRSHRGVVHVRECEWSGGHADRCSSTDVAPRFPVP